MLQKSTFQFLLDLKNNNHKAWFDEHKNQYQEAKQDVEQTVGHVLHALSKYDTNFAELKPAQCLFRIHRDVRFSKEKIPYKTNFGASLNSLGKKSSFAGFYLHIEPGASFCGGGLWLPPTPLLQTVRQEIDYQTEEFLTLLNESQFKRFYKDLSNEHRLQRIPKGYEEGHPAEKYLKLKSFVAMTPLSDSQLTTPKAPETIAQTLWALNPLIQFINRSILDVQ